MIVSAEVYPSAQHQQAMNCGLQQYDTVRFQPHRWPLNHQPLHSVIKKEPSDESDYYGKSDKMVYGGPLTPPGLNYNPPTSEYQKSEYQKADYQKSEYQKPDFQKSDYRSDYHGSPGELRASPTDYRSDYAARSSPEAVESAPTQTDESVDRVSCERTSPPLATLTPSVQITEGMTPPGSSPDATQKDEENPQESDSLRRLQMAMQRNGLLYEEKLQCPMCDFSCSVRATFNEHLVSHETKCSICEFNGETKEKLRDHLKTVHDIMVEEDHWTEEEPGLTTPKVNSQGKVKTFKCKQCEFSAVTKAEFWDHSKVHIKRDRILNCPKCPFITEYKHHLEYHLRNHFGSKPFKCDKCSYTCVNKSMLNSHLKSHSNVYQFRCSDCTYATKYCHSLKLHLRKYGHNPAMVLNPDGTPNPLPIVDVYGTRRGPKQKLKSEGSPSTPTQQQPPATQPIFNPYNFLPTQLPYYGLNMLVPPFPFAQDTPEEKNNNIEKVIDEEDEKEDKAPLDLTCPYSSQDTPVTKNRRKGKAYKIEKIALRLQHQEDEPENKRSRASPDVKSCEADSEQPKPDEYNCSYCDISFRDIVMYTMHMGYHGYQDPFTCNMCGQQTSDKVSFFLHIARTSHS